MAVGQEKLGTVNEAVIKAMGAFGGGVASSGNVCGILSGGVALISGIYSRGNLEEKDDPRMWRLSYKLFKIFEGLTEPYGGINCRDIARVDWRDREATKDFYKNPESRHKICAQLVGDVAFALGEILDKDAETAS
ncbi:MAG: C_GCAxxG_C_C family protein [Desulfobacteraceae bacterium]|nr:C_GCAxxG_C_C family protein [Desulfobacteraceae bacterium]